MTTWKSCLILTIAGVLAACGNPGTPDESGTPDAPAAEVPGKPKIALVMKSLANEFFLTMENGAKAHQQAHADHYDLIAQGIKDETDVARQIQLVEQMIAEQVDALVIAPADSKALVSVLKKAEESGVKVVNIDNKLDDAVVAEKGLQAPFVGPDNRAGAKKVADYLVGTLATGDPVAIVEGAPNAFNAQQRKLGFEDGLTAGGVKVVTSQTANWEMAQANQVVSGMITEHPELKAILCANDSMALGAVSALRAAGKTAEVKVVGFDNISAAKELLDKGELLATADQHADQLAVYGIEYALELIAGKQTPEDKETPVDLVTGAPGA